MSGDRIPLVDLRRQHAALEREITAAIGRVFEASDFILGAEVRAFEEEFAALCGCGHAIGCGNGTDALELALTAVGVKPADEVITVAHTFAATAEAIVRVGATPVFVDVAPDTLLMDVGRVERAVSARTRAIVPVHLYGSCVDMKPLLALARQRGLKVVEDAAQAHGAVVDGVRAGAQGDAAIFSFYPGKNLGAAGDAGMVVTSSAEIARHVRQARDHGRSGKYEHQTVGRNSRMDGLQAAVLRVKLRHLERWNDRRRQIAARYRFLLADVPQVEPVAASPGAPVYHLFVVQSDRRDDVRAVLDAAGVSTGVHYPVPLHLQPAFTGAAAPGSLPVTERAAGRILSLPMFPEMEDAEVDRVVTELSRAVHSLGLQAELA